MLSLDPVYYLKGLPLDYFTDFSRVASYFAKDYRKIKSRKVRISDDILDRVESYNRKIKADSRVFENIEHLKERPTVVTGQQPCLLTGPLFVIYKALTTVVLAEKLDAVPVFWNASEDDDVQEVNHLWVVNSGLEKISLELEQKPFSKIILKKEDVHGVISHLERLTPSTSFREDVLQIVELCSQSFSGMFSQILSTLFSEHGLILVEPHLFAELAVPVYEKLIEHPVTASALVNDAGTSLEETGYKRQLYKSSDSCSFYIMEDNIRNNVTYNGKFHVNNEIYTEKELLTLLDEHPDLFTSTVISRPLVQDFLFSTLAYCAGPGEISYFAQMRKVYDFFAIEEPYIVPRFGATLVEKKVEKVLRKYSIDVPDLIEPDRLAKALVREDIQEFFTRRKERILDIIEELEEYVTSIDVNLKKTGAAMRTHITSELKTLEEKTAASLKNQNRTVLEQIRKASLNIFPNQVLQERVLNIFQYLIRYRDLLDNMYKTFYDAQPGEHRLIYPGD